MSTRFAVLVFVTMLVLIGLDQWLNEGVYSLAWARRFVDLIGWVAFWR